MVQVIMVFCFCTHLIIKTVGITMNSSLCRRITRRVGRHVAVALIHDLGLVQNSPSHPVSSAADGSVETEVAPKVAKPKGQHGGLATKPFADRSHTIIA